MRPATAVVWEGLQSSRAYQIGTLYNINMKYLRENWQYSQAYRPRKEG